MRPEIFEAAVKSSKASENDREFCKADDLVQCKGEPYPIKRLVCWGRQKEGHRGCRRCPERSRQLYLFGSPRQVG